MGHIERVHVKDRRCETTEMFKSQRQTQSINDTFFDLVALQRFLYRVYNYIAVKLDNQWKWNLPADAYQAGDDTEDNQCH